MKTLEINKVIHPADMDCYDNGRKYPIYCTINYKDGKLSISGVIAPTRGGNCGGSCGQIDMEFNIATLNITTIKDGDN